MAQGLLKPQPARRTQKERRETTRANLLSAAVRCICRDGGAATTLSNVAAEAGLSKGAVQHHFSDKRALMSAVVEAGWADVISRLLGTSAVEGDLQDRLDTVIRHWTDAYSSPVCMAAREVNDASRGDPVLRERNRVLYRECREIIERNWSQVFADAPVPPERVRAAGRLAWAMLSGILGDMDTGPDMSDVRLDLATLKEATYRILTTPEGNGPGPAGNGASS